jgi:hypothetical protein
MKKHFNHNPFVFGMTVPFNGQRFKNPYFITDDSGEIHDAMPNGGGWCLRSGIIEDANVVYVRLSGTGESKVETMTGGWRIARDIDYFGKDYPMWCGEEYGFLYPDEVPAGHTAVPVSLYAYKDKKDKLAVPTIFVAQAKIVKHKDPTVKYYGAVEDIQQYVNHPAFWLDPNSSVLSNDEIMFSIYQLARFNKTLIHKEKESQRLIKLFEDVGIDELKYVPAFPYHLRLFLANEDLYAAMLRENPVVFNTGNPYLKDNVKTNVMSRFINGGRAPLKNKVDNNDWCTLSDFILSPLEYTNLLFGKKAFTIRRSGYKKD